ncbi:MAG: beta-propeller fold lactonase family protein [Planctomycetes bacterium]|nr:beta-propeller fold lactonase family protein [Planctomycetota bacterium]
MGLLSHDHGMLSDTTGDGCPQMEGLEDRLLLSGGACGAGAPEFDDPGESACVLPLADQADSIPPTLWVGLDGERLPYQFDMGHMNVGGASTALLTLRNDGTEDLQFRGWRFDNAAFTAEIVDPAGAGRIFMLAPMETATLAVTFSTDVLGEYTGKMSLFSSDWVFSERIFRLSARAEMIDLALSWDGVPLTGEQAEPIDFGILPLDEAFEPETVRVENTTAYSIDITAAYATGQFGGGFPPRLLPRTLEPGQGMNLSIYAFATEVGRQDGTLVIETDTPGVGPYVIPLTSAHQGADDGALTLDQVILNGVDGVTGMDSPRNVVISPDGRDVYVAGFDPTSPLNWFRVETAGGERRLVRQALTTDLEEGARVSMSPDGRNLCLIEGDGNLVVMSRDLATGQPSFVQRFTAASTEPKEIVFGPDGRNVYVSDWVDSYDRHGMGVFSRDAATGELTLDTVMLYGQGVLEPLTRVTAIDVSPDGEHLYAASHDGVLAVFDRDPSDGALTATTLYQNWNDDSLHRWIDDIAVGPDGRFAYVSISGDKAYVFQRDAATGTLIRIHAAPGDPDLYSSVPSLAFAPDGAHLYACAGAGGMLVFRVDTVCGALTLIGTIENTDTTQGLTPQAAVVSPDGTFVIACSSMENALLVLDRAAPVDFPTPIGVESITLNGGDAHRSSLTALSVRFSDDVAGGIHRTDVMLIDTTAGAAVDLTDAAVGFAYDPATRTATWDLSALAVGDGSYEATLLGVAIPRLDANGDGRAGGTAVTAFHVLRGDFDGDGALTVADTDDYARARRDGTATAPAFDLTGDGQIGDADLDTLIDDLVRVTRGDATADGSVDLDDFASLKQGFGTTAGATWAMGDFDANGAVDLDDFVLLKQHFGAGAVNASADLLGTSDGGRLRRHPRRTRARDAAPAVLDILAAARLTAPGR